MLKRWLRLILAKEKGGLYFMKKLRTKPFSLREETFALAFCMCSCACGCDGSCNCPVAPTHQIGLNAQADLTPLHDAIKNEMDSYTQKSDFFGLSGSNIP